MKIGTWLTNNRVAPLKSDEILCFPLEGGGFVVMAATKVRIPDPVPEFWGSDVRQEFISEPIRLKVDEWLVAQAATAE
jgi:hypothetical protein